MTQDCHAEVAEPQPNRSMQDLECYPAFGSSASSRRGGGRILSNLIGGQTLKRVQGDKIIKNLFTYSPTNLLTSKKAAFTLAEVLITLAIIGVVAALTIPTLISNYNDKVLETQKVKTKAMLNNAFKMIMAQDGTAGLNATSLANCDDQECFANELKKVLRISYDLDMESDDANMKYTFTNGEKEVWSDKKVYSFINSDGAIYGLEDTDDDSFSFVVDLNGFKSPNTGGKDLCRFSISNSAVVTEDCSSMKSFKVVTKPRYGTCLVQHSNDPDMCVECESGYYPSGYDCVSCESKFCSECNSKTGECSACVDGFYLENGNCLEDR